MEIIDNFLPEDQFKSLQNIILSTYFPWNYIDKESYTETKDSFLFFHNFYRGIDSPSEYFSIINPCLQILGGELFRAKAVLTPKTENPRFSGFHIDYEDMKTAIFYINTNNGYTEFENGVRVNSVANRVCIFDSNLNHRGVTHTEGDQQRIVVNFNYD